MQNEFFKKEFVVNWKRTFSAPLKQWWIIGIVAILGAVLGYVAGLVFAKPSYQMQAVYIIQFDYENISGGSVGDIYSQWNLSTKILANCQEVANQNAYRKAISDKINVGLSEDDKQYISDEMLQMALTSEKVGSSYSTILAVTVTTSSQETSLRIIRGVVDTFENYMTDKFNYEFSRATITFDLVNLPEQSMERVSKITKKLTTVLGGVAAAALCYVIVWFKELSDIKIKSVDDLKNKYNAPVLGEIYDFNAEDVSGKEAYKYGY